MLSLKALSSTSRLYVFRSSCEVKALVNLLPRFPFRAQMLMVAGVEKYFQVHNLDFDTCVFDLCIATSLLAQL